MTPNVCLRLGTIVCHLLLVSWLRPLATTAGSPREVVLENAHFQYAISATGANRRFLDRASGTDYLRSNPSSPCAVLRCNGKAVSATSATLTRGRLTLGFRDANAGAVLRVESRGMSIWLTVQSLQGEGIESLTFLNVPLTLKGAPDEPFGACAFSLNPITRVDQLPALQTELRASCERKFGLLGAKVALAAVPPQHMLSALKEARRQTDEMPLCQVAGPWAAEIPFNRGSYLFNFGNLTEATTDDWIAMAQSLGVSQIDNHGGSAAFFRFGDFELNRKKWPDGWQTYARIVEKLHQAGIGSIFHTYAFFIDKQSKYVTPVPDPRLDAFRAFTLTESVSADADTIPVNESTAGMSTITGFFEHNSVILHVGDELITFGGASRTPPWQFTGVKRGAFGTQASAHSGGAKARHLKECFGLLVPDVESTLFEEIAANHAAVVNEGNFDGIYLDAIDGSSILRGSEDCWYWADKFVFEIQKRLRRPVGMEMSAMWHHFWQYRTRWQAWDYPQRGHQRFIDLHAQGVNGGLLLPLHLGWWNFQSFNPPQVEPSYPEVMEYLGAKLIGWNAGISLTGAIDRERLRNTPLFRRAVDILRASEELRRDTSFDDAKRKELRQAGAEFAFVTNATGKPRLVRSHAAPHTANPAEPWTLSWHVDNPFPEQPLRLRLEALMSVADADDTHAVPLLNSAGVEDAKAQKTAANGVTFSIAAATDAARADGLLWKATNAGQVPQNAAWAKWTRSFDPPLNLKNQPALGFWIEGDGSGAVVAVRLESPKHLAFGAAADRYVTLDFTGRRQLQLVETESTRWNDFVWNDGKGLYNLYRETIDFAAVEQVSVWLQNLPAGKEVQCAIGPIRALPFAGVSVTEPALSLNGAEIRFPAEIPAGGWIEYEGTTSASLFDPQGTLLRTFEVSQPSPRLHQGDNSLQLPVAPKAGPAPRVRVVVFSRGDAL